ncbi:hypothetical protein [Pseudomonas aeruginosa]|uniref:hypothetical protein n=2 Tax=Pseudomonas aeruginosa TaxID=287 RepID=UPI00053D8E68|nr:hypothetical protein [Pseudomonas aeruginosa]MCG7158932.1 hypothetical protein [Pseudomonas aeruginosa]MCG7185748.1 hypothetical protein [Pseudomonas aeruginosa]MCG7188152.1 hypothetical protein [Pseudomonas aeruginosa]HDP4782589.1 hypothetical protein [Pseudomonas aeruginosa]HDP4801814.1 hypothetical protein [Pseudomonas aeruginosa]
MAMLPDRFTITFRPRSLLAGALLSPAVVLLGWWVCGWSWDSAYAPAWVQAIGSIGAILAAVSVAWFADHRTEQRKQVSEEKVRILLKEIAVRILRSGSELVDQLDTINNVGARWVQVERVVDRESNLLFGFNVLDAPSPEIAQAVLDLRGALMSQRHHLDQLVAGVGSSAFPTFQVKCKDVVESARILLDGLNK